MCVVPVKGFQLLLSAWLLNKPRIQTPLADTGFPEEASANPEKTVLLAKCLKNGMKLKRNLGPQGWVECRERGSGAGNPRDATSLRVGGAPGVSGLGGAPGTSGLSGVLGARWGTRGLRAVTFCIVAQQTEDTDTIGGYRIS